MADLTLLDWPSRTVPLPVPAPTSQEFADDIKTLKTMALDERPDALGEIVAQADEFLSLFLALVGATASTHPATMKLLNTADAVTAMITMHYKAKINRARPVQVIPGLLPPIPHTGHPSYPSGHATQAYIFAKFLAHIIPTTTHPGLADVANALAARVGRNREIAGLHWPSDTKAGVDLAGKIFAMLTDTAFMRNGASTPSRFERMIDAAKAEW
jgi:hypothetical protein